MREPRFLVSRIAEVDMADCCLNEPIIRRGYLQLFCKAKAASIAKSLRPLACTWYAHGGEGESFLPSRLPFARREGPRTVAVRTPHACGFNDPCVQRVRRKSAKTAAKRRDPLLPFLRGAFTFLSPFCVSPARPRIARNAARGAAKTRCSRNARDEILLSAWQMRSPFCRQRGKQSRNRIDAMLLYRKTFRLAGL